MNLPAPLHPALVHFPIVLILLGAALAVAAIFFRRAWLAWSVAVVMALAAAGSLAAIWSGENDEDAAERSGAAAEQVLDAHEDWGERARNLAIVGAVAAVGAVLVVKRPPAVSMSASLLTAVLAIGASWCVIEAGHYGGKLVYQHGVNVKASTLPADSGSTSRDDDD
jgi:uncharacterized membrane protein